MCLAMLEVREDAWEPMVPHHTRHFYGIVQVSLANDDKREEEGDDAAPFFAYCTSRSEDGGSGGVAGRHQLHPPREGAPSSSTMHAPHHRHFGGRCEAWNL